MHPIVGMGFGGAVLTPFNDPRVARGKLGCPVWGPYELLEDLELSLGLFRRAGDAPVRTACWLERMRVHGERTRFYSRALQVDPWGTAAALLGLRDALVEAGWRGQRVLNGGARICAIAELEQSGEPELPVGMADRLAAVGAALEQGVPKRYRALTLAEAMSEWPGGWQRVFRCLGRAGVRLEQLRVHVKGAVLESDLGKVQRALRTEAPRGAVTLRGDGSLLVLTAETALEAARAAAAVLATQEAERCVVIREQDAASLEYGLTVQGLPTQGWRPRSPWRAALQVLPLAIELAFEPKDPYRVWDLLCLPRGPFAGLVSRRLRAALQRAPGVGGRDWEEAKRQLPQPREAVLQRIADWFERPGAARSGATKPFILAVVERVRAWLVQQLERAREDETLRSAVQQCHVFAQVVSMDGRERFDLIALRRLMRSVSEVAAVSEWLVEGAGRCAHVDSPAALWGARETILWWPFSEQDLPRTPAWRRRERAALAAAGVLLSDVQASLRARAESFRRCVWSATERLVLVVPQMLEGQRLGVHPLWDEIVARADLSVAACARVTLSAGALLNVTSTRDHESVFGSVDPPRVALEPSPPLPLPGAQPSWQLDGVPWQGSKNWSAASLAVLLGCPLAWALRYLAGIRSEPWGPPAQHLLNGNLGHRLIEQLFRAHAFGQSQEDFDILVEQELEALFATEGAPLLRPGKVHEYAQLRRSLSRAARALRRALEDNQLTPFDVEAGFEVPWRGGTLSGRWDLLARARDGQVLIIDLKWGRRKYEKDLELGASLQLATYLEASLRTMVPADGAVYYSLSKAQLFGHGSGAAPHLDEVRGPSLKETWRRIERTLPLLEQCLVSGQLPVAGVASAEPLLDVLGVNPTEQEEYFVVEPSKACGYCQFDGLCGKRWESER